MTDLYRFYDTTDQLLYVGISIHAAQRAGQHRHASPWWSDAVRMEVERYPDRSSAEDAERRAIINEHPLHNVVHNRSRTSTTGRPQRTGNEWQCPTCEKTILFGPRENGYITLRDELWEVRCRKCDSGTDGRYWIDTGRIQTLEHAKDWTHHLSRKRWFIFDAWLRIFEEHKGGWQEHHSDALEKASLERPRAYYLP
jgi:hypothetical protein